MMNKNKQKLSLSKPVHSHEHKLLGDETGTIEISLLLKSPEIDKESERELELPRRQYLNKKELDDRFAVDRLVLERIKAFTQEYGLEILAHNKARRRVRVRGPAAAMNRAFSVNLKKYDNQSVIYHSHEEDISLPSDIADIVETVVGLDKVPLLGPSAVAAALHGDQQITVTELKKRYQFPKNAGKGQRVAILAFGGGYHQQDLDAHFKKLGLPVPKINVRSLDGVKNSPLDYEKLSQMMPDLIDPDITLAEMVKKWTGPLMLLGKSTMEVTMDIQIVGSIAPEAEIDLFFAPNHKDAFGEAVAAASGLGDDPSIPTSDVISISWGAREALWGNSATSISNTLKLATMSGTTISCSSGDYGSVDVNSESIDDANKANTHFPASSPFSLACGATGFADHTTSDATEVVWSCDYKGIRQASGGGVSGFFSQLSHQHHLDSPTHAQLNGAAWINPNIENPDSFRGRSLPDVAAFGDPTHGIEIILGGHIVAGGGTSAAAPIWAGLMSCINSSIGMNAGWVNPSLYTIPLAFKDITSGNNRIYKNGAAYFEARPGFDLCSGLGTPNGSEILKELSRLFNQRDDDPS